METVSRVVDQAVDVVTRTIYGNAEDTEQKNQHTKPAEADPKEQKETPTAGPGHSVYLNKPISTTSNNTETITDDLSKLQINPPPNSGEPVLRDTAAAGRARSDSGHAESEGISERFSRPPTTSNAQQLYGQESIVDDGISRTGEESILSPDGQIRPKFTGNETNDDGIRRADGRDRVQFDDSRGSTGNLKPSGEPSPERPRQGSAGALPPMDPENKGGIPHMDFGNKGALLQGARIGTVQGGTERDRHHSRDLEDAQTAQSGGFGGTPVMFGATRSYDHTGTSQVQIQQKKVEHPSSSNEPHSQGEITNPATTNSISPMGPGLTKGTHGPVEPSVGSHPAHAQQQTQKHQGGDRPTEEPQGHVPQPGVDQKNTEGENKEAGHLWVKTSGTAADGGDFDATKPGAGKEADRLLEQAGVHRELDPRAQKSEDTKGVKDTHHQTSTTSGNPSNPIHHPDFAADHEKGSHGGVHMPGILHHHDNKKDPKPNDAGGDATHKGFFDKLKEKVKLHKDQ